MLIMMTNTGGGHKASAEALKQAFEEKYGDEYKVREPLGVCVCVCAAGRTASTSCAPSK